MTTSLVVELTAARKRFGDVEALRGVDLAIDRGEVVALLGPNGAGKTTAISLMLGLRRPTSGRARLLGLDPTDRRARSRCGAMLQESGVSGVLTVREAVALFGAYYPAPLATERVLELAGLAEVGRARIGTLSTGQRQRVFFALAVCGDPEVLFLDEPTAAMDVEGRRVFLDTLRRFSAEGRTLILTTHHLEEADALARRVVVVDHGVVVADAAPAEIKARIPTRRVSFRADAAAPEALDGLPVARRTVEGGRVTLVTSEPESVLRALFARGVEVRELEVTGATLEEAFLTLTGRGPGSP